jgi:CheY-like chemotaxis protein
MSQTPEPPILLLDDDPNDRFFVRLALSECRIGNPVIECDSAVRARGHLERFAPPSLDLPPVLLIIDLSLAGAESGLDFLQWVREESAFRHMPAIVLTGSDKPLDRDASFALGAYYYLQKPVSESGLVFALDALGLLKTSPAAGDDEAVRVLGRG